MDSPRRRSKHCCIPETLEPRRLLSAALQALPTIAPAVTAHALQTGSVRTEYHESTLTGLAPSVQSAATVVGRYVFYNNSRYDGYQPAANSLDDAAIAPDKQALLPGGAATSWNYTSYSRGLNGLMVDISGLTGEVQLSDFKFRAGDDNNPAGWAVAPSPSSMLVRPGAGTGGSTRIEFTWPDSAIRNEWLEVVVLDVLDQMSCHSFREVVILSDRDFHELSLPLLVRLRNWQLAKEVEHDQ